MVASSSIIGSSGWDNCCIPGLMKGSKKEKGAEFCWDMLGWQQQLSGDFKTTSTAFRQLNRGECKVEVDFAKSAARCRVYFRNREGVSSRVLVTDIDHDRSVWKQKYWASCDVAWTGASQENPDSILP